jgi:hypothetical protein
LREFSAERHHRQRAALPLPGNEIEIYPLILPEILRRRAKAA